MRKIPVNQNELNLTAIQVVPVLDQDEVQKTNSHDIPLWEVHVLSENDGKRPELEFVKIASEKAPQASGKVIFTDLIARPWDMNGRSGVSLSATGVKAKVQAS